MSFTFLNLRLDQSNPISSFCYIYVFAHQSFVLMMCRWHTYTNTHTLTAAHYHAELGMPKGVCWSITRNCICNFELINHNFYFSKFWRCMEVVTFLWQWRQQYFVDCVYRRIYVVVVVDIHNVRHSCYCKKRHYWISVYSKFPQANEISILSKWSFQI